MGESSKFKSWQKKPTHKCIFFGSIYFTFKNRGNDLKCNSGFLCCLYEGFLWFWSCSFWLSYWSLGLIPLWGNSSISAPFLMYASIKIFALEILLGFWPKIILSGHHLQYSWNSIPCFPLFVDFIVHEIFLFPINFQVQLCI